MLKAEKKQKMKALTLLRVLMGTLRLLTNTRQTGKEKFPIQMGSLGQEILDIPVLKPKNVFAENSFFFAGNQLMIDLTEKKGSAGGP